MEKRKQESNGIRCVSCCLNSEHPFYFRKILTTWILAESSVLSLTIRADEPSSLPALGCWRSRVWSRLWSPELGFDKNDATIQEWGEITQGVVDKVCTLGLRIKGQCCYLCTHTRFHPSFKLGHSCSWLPSLGPWPLFEMGSQISC